MRDQVLWRKTGRIASLLADSLNIDAERALLADSLNIDAERALDILYNSRTYSLLINPESGLQLQSDQYILVDLLRELEA